MLNQQEVREKLLDRTGRETQASVAKKIGVPTSVISKFKNGQDLWDDTLIALNNYLDGTRTLEEIQTDQAVNKNKI